MDVLAMSNDNTNLEEQMQQLGKNARHAFRLISIAQTEQKNKALTIAAQTIRERADSIKSANEKDMQTAKEKGISGAFLDRLELNDARIEAMAVGIDEIAALDDPVGKELDSWVRPNGLKISRVSVPLGVIGIIYESRPNVTADAGALCLKAGNVAILRGGSESFYSSQAILECLHKGLCEAGLPETVVQSLPTADREAVGMMLKMAEDIDVIIPRGGKGLIKRIIEESRIPTIQHLDGNCHTYIHTKADQHMAVDVTHNAKLRRTGLCNATESILIDEAIANEFLPKLLDDMSKGCEFRGDKKAQAIDDRIVPANDEDWDTEYLNAIVSVKIVEGIDEAITWINEHSSNHTEAIITNDDSAAERFLNDIDSGSVLHNASTQFADGGQYGLGAEIGISTNRLHARGPVGVDQLTTFKYVVRGQGQTRPS